MGGWTQAELNATSYALPLTMRAGHVIILEKLF